MAGRVSVSGRRTPAEHGLPELAWGVLSPALAQPSALSRLEIPAPPPHRPALPVHAFVSLSVRIRLIVV
jgi:hypothetical protein